VDLLVAVQRGLPAPAGIPALVSEPLGQIGDRVFERRRDGGEVLLIGRDQSGVGLGGETGGQSERASWQEDTAVQEESPHKSAIEVRHDKAKSPRS
jgi:hypothetical protein